MIIYLTIDICDDITNYCDTVLTVMKKTDYSSHEYSEEL